MKNEDNDFSVNTKSTINQPFWLLMNGSFANAMILFFSLMNRMMLLFYHREHHFKPFNGSNGMTDICRKYNGLSGRKIK